MVIAFDGCDTIVDREEPMGLNSSIWVDDCAAFPVEECWRVLLPSLNRHFVGANVNVCVDGRLYGPGGRGEKRNGVWWTTPYQNLKKRVACRLYLNFRDADNLDAYAEPFCVRARGYIYPFYLSIDNGADSLIWEPCAIEDVESSESDSETGNLARSSRRAQFR